MKLAFVDIESTGLDPRCHEPWEVAVIIGDEEHVWTWRPSEKVMEAADPKALEIGRFHERAPKAADGSERAAAHDIAGILAGTIIVGSNPSFDVAMIRSWLKPVGILDVHYRSIDVATMAAGWVHGFARCHEIHAAEGGFDRDPVPIEVGTLPWKSYQLSELVGVDPPSDAERHTALGDARWAKRLYETITGGAA